MTRNDTIAFLTCVLPPEGQYCAVVFNPKPWHQFFETIGQLADFILQQDQLGRTVYHACASFREAGKRTQQNALMARSLWLDIDTREGPPPSADAKPRIWEAWQNRYADRHDAAAATLDFCRAAGLPAPLFVDSGFGLHCYWPLERPLAPDEWHRSAGALKALCFEHGLKIDPGKTADLACILRTPGTHNRKNGERLVRSSEPPFVQYDPGLFAGLARGRGIAPRRYETDTRQRPVVAGEPSERTSGRRSISASICAGASYGAVYADDVADRCAQLGALRESGSVEGWFLRVGVLAFCADGEVKAHEWSANDYPEYDPRVVDDRLVRSRQLSGATTCERFHGVDPAMCERCPLWGHIKSPISAPFHELSDRSRSQAAFPGDGPRQAVESPAGDDGPKQELNGAHYLPPGFEVRDNKLIAVSEDARGQRAETLICNYIRLKSVQTGELDRTSHSYCFEHHLPKKGFVDVIMDAKVLFSSSGISELAGKGVVVHDAKMFMNYARLIVDDFNEQSDTHIRYDQFGWKNDNTAFLYGRHLYTPGGPVEAIGAKEVETRSQWIGPKPRGNVEAWTEAADALFASDMEAYSAMVLASFAAPLMRFQSADEGGAILHLFTPGSGQGKTTALNAAWTVWGSKEGLALTNEDTRVSKPIAIGTLANLPVIYDELRDKDPEYIRRMVVMFTEGRDRMRGMVDGTIRHTKANWQTIMLSAANNSLIDQLQGDGVDAPAFRVLEMSSTLSRAIDKTKGDRLKRILNDNAGHAGDAYLRYLLHPPVLEFAQRSLEQWTQEIWDITRLDSAHRFRVRAVGAIAVASALVNKLGILHFQTDRILHWLIKELGSGRNVGTVSATMPAEHATNALGEFINEHLGEMLVVRKAWRPRQEKQTMIVRPQHRLSIRYEIEPQRVFISETVLREWMLKKQFSPRTVIDTLEKAMVVTNRRRGITLSAGTDIPGAQVMCIEINANHPSMSGLVASVGELQQSTG